MTLPDLVALMVLEAGCPQQHHPRVCDRVERDAARMAPDLLAAHEAEPVAVLPVVVRRIWRESSYRRWPLGDDGEVGPAQIMAGTGRRLCPDLAWDRPGKDHFQCMLRVLAWYEHQCGTTRVHGAYKGKCQVRRTPMRWTRKKTASVIHADAR